jgi:penicillin-binding protein-related factor A (putative recombinase)
MDKREQALTTRVISWLKNNQDKGAFPNHFAFVFEVKVAKDKDPIPFSNIQPHQIRALEIAKHDTFVWKFSDLSRLGTPADGVFVRKMAGLFIFYWERKGNKIFYFVDVDVFINEKETSKRKSLTEARAKEIAMLVGTLA